MRDLIRAEWFKLSKSRTFKVLVILNLTVFFVDWIMYSFRLCNPPPRPKLGYMLLPTELQYILHHEVIGYVLAATYICSEFSQRTWGTSLLSGYARKKLLLSKMIVFVGANVFLVLVYTVSGTLLTTIYSGGYIETVNAEMWECTIMLLLYGILGYSVFGVVMVATAVVIKKKVGTIIFGMLSSYIMTQTDIITRDNPLPFTKYTYAYQLRHLKYKDWTGPCYWGGPFEPGVYLGVMAVTFIVSMVVAVYAFNRVELK
ncbi:MAG: ABC transporter permease [Lachnospiraceae bacterium]|nr:ABC transporter permease [Lachnospiraceae bacterium]